MLDVKNEPVLKDGEPCGHPGCLSHVSHPCEGCGRIGGYKKATPPETIYLQCYDENGNLLSAIGGVWCRDRINDNDAIYILITPELAGLLRDVVKIIQMSLVRINVWDVMDTRISEELQDILAGTLLRKTINRARVLLERVKDNLG